jgi:sigma-B regulation protein RsbU (phosphoserine phosphatase)
MDDDGGYTLAMMPTNVAWRKSALAALAVLLAAAAFGYGFIWMVSVRNAIPRVELGFNYKANVAYDPQARSIYVHDVEKGSPAERAGLRAGDRIIGFNGQLLATSRPYDEAYARGKPGDPVALTVLRAGKPGPMVLHGVFRASTGIYGAAGPVSPIEGIARSSARQVTDLYPLPFLLVGFAVLFLRLRDPKAWLLALLFCAFTCVPDLPDALPFAPLLVAFAQRCRAVFSGMLPPLFYLFFAVFPQRSHLDRRVPWLKWAGFAYGASVVLPALRTGNPNLPAVVARLVGADASSLIRLSLAYALFILGLVSLVQNSFLAEVPAEARRKSRVILWGTGLAVVPIVLERMAADLAGFRSTFWLDTVLAFLVILYPLSFAYAVVKHRVLEIPVLLRRSARFLFVQRGFVVLMVGVTALAIWLFTHVFSRFARVEANLGMALSAVFGIVLVWAAEPAVKRITAGIDRAFFRSAYDSRVILRELAEKTRTVSDRRQLALLIERYATEALHPKRLAGYFADEKGRLAAFTGTVPAQLETLAARTPFLSALERHGKARDDGPWGELLPLAPECVVPILGRENDLIGMLVLGQRLSEEPYSHEDKQLLDAVASHAGIALENIRLAEKMAERFEADRRAAQEMEIARQVQSRLFPQELPAIRTLEYTGACIQAKQVGGDYYDFLELRPDRLALVLADIAGKGVSGALLMANLQANLRSQYALAIDDLPRLLVAVNRLFFRNTDDSSYATLFFGDYDGASRKLRYANCGHLPPLLLRALRPAAGPGRAAPRAEWLPSTSTVMGMFADWRCEIAEVQLAPGDVLVLYTDGITEAANAAGEEFGASRLLDAVAGNALLPLPALLQAVVWEVRQFSDRVELQDDITLVIARALA